jgi:hypothetical protein
MGKQELDSYILYPYFPHVPLWINIDCVQGCPLVCEGSHTGDFLLCEKYGGSEAGFEKKYKCSIV